MFNCWQCCTSQPKVSSPSHEEPTQSFPPPSIPTTSLPPPVIKSMEVIIEQLQQVNPTDEIDPLISFIEYLLQRIKASPTEESTSSSSSDSNTRLAEDFIKNVSTEALRSKDVLKDLRDLALNGLKMVGEAYWPFLGLSVAAYSLERYVTASSNVSECVELLQKIALLAKDLKQFKELMPGETDRLCLVVQIIVEGAVMCCDYISKRKIGRLKMVYVCKEY